MQSHRYDFNCELKWRNMAENDHKYFEKRKDERETIHRAIRNDFLRQQGRFRLLRFREQEVNKCNVHEVYRFYARGCVHLVGVLYRSTWQGIKGVRWVAILSGSSRAFYSPPPSPFPPLRSLFLRSLQVTRRDMEIIWRIIIVLDQMRLISTPREISNLRILCRFRFTSVLFTRFSVWFSLFLLSGLKMDFYTFISSRKKKGFWEINSFFFSLSSLKLVQRNSVVNLECTF